MALLNNFIGEKQFLEQLETGKVDPDFAHLTPEQVQECRHRVSVQQDYLQQCKIIDEQCNLLQDIDSILETRNQLTQYYATVQQRY